MATQSNSEENMKALSNQADTFSAESEKFKAVQVKLATMSGDELLHHYRASYHYSEMARERMNMEVWESERDYHELVGNEMLKRMDDRYWHERRLTKGNDMEPSDG